MILPNPCRRRHIHDASPAVELREVLDRIAGRIRSRSQIHVDREFLFERGNKPRDVRSADGALDIDSVLRTRVNLLRYPLHGVGQATERFPSEDDGDAGRVVRAARSARHPLGPDVAPGSILQFPDRVAILRPRRRRGDQSDSMRHFCFSGKWRFEATFG